MTERSYDGKLWSEFTDEDLKAFRLDWIKAYAHDLVVECGEPDNETTREVAEIRFEDYCGQEGWTGRDERIAQEREG